MVLSRCFERSKEANKLGCISCHDPHKPIGPDQRVSFYRQRCLNCHREELGKNPDLVSCSLPPDQRRRQNVEDSCIHCHMQRYRASDIVHNASTDHRILRRPQKADDGSAGVPAGVDIPLALFHQGPVNPKDKERSRDLGIALTRLAVQGKIGGRQIQNALALLEKSLQPDDLEAWQEKAELLLLLGRKSQALGALETILKQEPKRELALVQAAALSEDADRAVDFWRRAVAANPWMAQYRAGLAQVSAHLGAWKESRRECQAWLLFIAANGAGPASIDARKLWIECLLQDRQVAEARAEFARIVALKPADLDQLKSWFDKLIN